MAQDRQPAILKTSQKLWMTKHIRKLRLANQPLNILHFQFNPTILRLLEKKPFISKMNEDVNKHYENFL